MRIYDLLKWIFSRIIDIFFREIKVRGSHKIPTTGPVIFIIAPHSNQLLDPLLVIRNCPRRISMLTAKKTSDRKFVGTLAHAMGISLFLLMIVPVTRAQDCVRRGIGQISLDEKDSLLLIGHNTQFLTDLKARDCLILEGLGILEISRIMSDNQVILKEINEDQKSAFSNGNKLAFKILPYVTQTAMFQAVVDNLVKGKCVGLFPEGGSHDRSELLPIKAGFAIMALTAMSAHSDLNVKIVPVGLNYFHPDKFRSRAVVEFGDPIDIDQTLVDQFKSGGEEKRKAIAFLVDKGHQRLKNLTLSAPDYDTLMVIQAARRLYRPEHVKLDLDQTTALARNFLIGYEKFGNEPKVRELTKSVQEYNQLLKIYGIRDHQVKTISIGGIRAFELVLYRLMILLLLFFAIIPGILLNAPIAIVAHKISKQKAKEALAASSVKIHGKDVIATWKVTVAAVLIPALYLTYALIAGTFLLFYLKFDIMGSLSICIVLFSLFLPLFSLFTLKGADFVMDIFKSLRPLILCLLPGTDSMKLVKIRNELQKFLNEVIEEYGPKAFADFEKHKIIPSQAFSPAEASPENDEFRWNEVDPEEIDEVFIYQRDKKVD